MTPEEAVSLLHSRGLTEGEIAAVIIVIWSSGYSLGLERRAGQ